MGMILERWYDKVYPNKNQVVAMIDYVHVEQGIIFNQKNIHKTTHHLTLYETEMTSASQHFELESIHDISYRSFSSDHGFLYLHTHQGVFAYKIETEPSHFINLFHDLKVKHES